MHDPSHVQQSLDAHVARAVELLEAGLSVDVTQLAGDNAEHRKALEQLLPTLEAMVALGHSAVVPAVDRQRAAAEGGGHYALGVLGDFRIAREIGRGGMGVVYEAEQISLSRRVALKVLPFAATLDDRQIQRFRNESLLAAQLDHPNIVNVYGVGCERSVHFFAMRYIDGATLDQYVSHRRALSPPSGDAERLSGTRESGDGSSHGGEEDVGTRPIGASTTFPATTKREYHRTVVRLGIQIADALEYAHQEGVIHRDVKPSNIMIDASGNAWVADFGLARVQQSAVGTLTLSSDMIGTLRYMSPEQVSAAHDIVDHRTDIYSFGLTLYELLALTPAFASPDRLELVRQITTEVPTPLRQIDRSIPVDLETIVLKATAKCPEERYGRMADVAEDLQKYLDCRPIQAKRPSLAYQVSKGVQRHGRLLALLAVASVLASIATLVAWQRETRLRKEAESNQLQAQTNLDVALGAIGGIIASAVNTGHFLDPRFANDEMIKPAIEELNKLREASGDVRVTYELARLHAAFARNLDRLGFDSMDEALLADDLASALPDRSVVGSRGVHYATKGAVVYACLYRGWRSAACAAAAERFHLTKLGGWTLAHQSYVCHDYAHLLRVTHRPRDAEVYSRQGVNLARQWESNGPLVGASLANRATRILVLIDVGSWEDANLLADEMLRLVLEMPDGDYKMKRFYEKCIAVAYLTVAQLRTGQGFVGEAIEQIDQALGILPSEVEPNYQTGSFFYQAECHQVLSDCLALQHDWERAEYHARESINHWKDLGFDSGLCNVAMTRFRLAQVLWAADRADEAREEFRTAFDILRDKVDRMPDETYYIGQLLMVLTLSPERPNDEMAASLANQAGLPESRALCRYRALALSHVDQHELAMHAIDTVVNGTTGADAVDDLIATIVYGSAGEFDKATTFYERAQVALEANEPINFLDFGPLVTAQLRERAAIVCGQ